MTSRAERLGLASGLIFALLQIAVLSFITVAVVSKVPAPGAPAVERAASYVEHGAALRIGNYLMLLPVPFILLFSAAAAGLLQRRTGSPTLPLLVVGSAAAMAMLWPLGGAVSTIALLIAEGSGDPVVVASLDAIAPYTLALSAVPRSVFIAALSAGLFHGRIGPRWLGPAGAGVAGLSLVGSGVLALDALFPLLALSTLLFLVWMIFGSFVLLRSSTRDTSGRGLEVASPLPELAER